MPFPSEHNTFPQTGTKFNVQKSETHVNTALNGYKNPNYPSPSTPKGPKDSEGKKYTRQQTLKIPPPRLNRYLYFTLFTTTDSFKKKKKDMAEALPMPSPPLPSLPKQWFLLLCNSHTFLTSYYNLSFNEVSIHKKTHINIIWYVF